MAEHEGLRLMQVEMDRQCGDALASMRDGGSEAARIADAARKAGRLVLYGMGGSHYVNRMVEPLYRDAGIECRAMAASEALMAPLPPASRVALFVSQSGESGEIVDLLAQPAPGDRRFGITLNRESTLGNAVDGVLVGAGGSENAFAATRSIILTLAMHAAILEALGQGQDALRTILADDAPADIAAVDEGIAGCDVVVFAGRHVMQGVAQSGALSLMELSRVPAIGFETGQFRHGPFEFLRPGLGIVLLRSSGRDKDGIPAVAAATVEAGCRTIVFDASGEPLPPGCIGVTLPRNEGIAAAASMLLSFQRLNIAVARRRISRDIGTPLRTTKVTV
ncbi:MAG: aminotransferase [Microvirga sp.]